MRQRTIAFLNSWLSWSMTFEAPKQYSAELDKKTTIPPGHVELRVALGLQLDGLTKNNIQSLPHQSNLST